jgi:hypothetical protein
MKQVFLKSLAALAILGFAACNTQTASESSTSDSTALGASETALETGMEVSGAPMELDPNGSYTDLSTGEAIQLRRDENGHILNMETGRPVEFYVDMNTQDTFYGKTGVQVNNALRYNNGVYEVDETRMNDDYKETLEGDEYKLKDGDTKIKANDGEYKYKDGDTKIKSNKNETKIKSGNTKIEIEDGKTKVKTDD